MTEQRGIYHFDAPEYRFLNLNFFSVYPDKSALYAIPLNLFIALRWHLEPVYAMSSAKRMMSEFFVSSSEKLNAVFDL